MDLTLVLTHGCNLGCGYCFAGEKSARAMTLETGTRALALAADEAAAAAGRRLDVAFFGGEPLLEWDLLLGLADEALRLTAARGLACGFSVTTNGTLLTPERAQALEARGFHVGLSTDGLPAAQDLARPDRGGGPSSVRVARGLEAAVAHVTALSVIVVVDPRTVRLLAAGVAHLAAQGVRTVHLNPNWAARWTPADLRAWREAYEAIASLWAARHREGAPLEVTTIDPRVTQRVQGVRTRPCGFGREELAVAPSGRIYACGRVVGEDRGDACGARGPLGDLARGLDRGKQAALPTAGAADPPECQACALNERCNRGCGCASLECGEAPGAPGALLCWHERMSIPLADRAAAALFAERVPSFMSRFYDDAPALLEVS